MRIAAAVCVCLALASCGDKRGGGQSCGGNGGVGAALSLDASVECVIEDVRRTVGGGEVPPAGAFFAAMRRSADSLKAAGHVDSIGGCVDALIDVVYRVWGVEFDPNQDDLLSLLPHTIVERKKGSCLGVSLLFLMLAERTGCPLHGVLLPGHFFVRYRRDSLERNIEPNLQGYSHPDSYYRRRYAIGQESWYTMRDLSAGEVLGVLYYNLGNIYRLRNNLRCAAQSYQRSAQAIEGYGEAWGNLGIVYECLGKTDSARAAFQRALDVRPDLPNLALNFGTLELRHKSYQRALKLYGKGLEAYPGDPDLYYGAALAHYGLRQKDSVAALVSVLKRDFPDYGKLDQLQELIR